MLSLFFIDEVAKYRRYDEAGEQPGEYAQIFEEEYNAKLNEVLTLEDTPYNRYLKGIEAARRTTAISPSTRRPSAWSTRRQRRAANPPGKPTTWMPTT